MVLATSKYIENSKDVGCRDHLAEVRHSAKRHPRLHWKKATEGIQHVKWHVVIADGVSKALNDAVFAVVVHPDFVVALVKGSAPGCIPKLLFSRPDSALHRGNQALCARSFTHRCVSVGIKKDPDRVRFIRAILKSKGLSMWSCLPLCLWAPGSAPAPWKQPLRKYLQDTLFPEAGNWGS